MLYDNQLSYKDYDKILQRTDADGWDYQCPNPECQAMGCFKRYSTYFRHLIVFEDGTLFDYEIEILRLKCLSCGITTNILPLEVIPFWQYSISLVLFILSITSTTDNVSVLHTAEEIASSFQLFYRYLLILREYNDRMVLLFRSLFLWSEKRNPSFEEIVSLARSKSPPFPQEDFLKMYRYPLFLHRRSTVSYPLRFGFRLS